MLLPTESLECFKKITVGGSIDKVEYNFCGSWCDIWSLGRMIVSLYEGRNDIAKDNIYRVSFSFILPMYYMLLLSIILN